MTVQSMTKDHEKYCAKMNTDHANKVKMLTSEFDQKMAKKEE